MYGFGWLCGWLMGEGAYGMGCVVVWVCVWVRKYKGVVVYT